MTNSKTEYSTSNASKKLTYNQWLDLIKTYSKKYKQFGSFLPAQEQILKQLYYSIMQWEQKVVSFTAPPASGKTHVIVLCAAYLANEGFSTCIVTPNSELKTDFIDELQELESIKPKITIKSIVSYRKNKDDFDYVFIDEAHNLRSSIELEESVVKSFRFEEGDALFDELTSGLKSTNYVVKELNIETASDLLKKMYNSKWKRDVKQLLNTISKWRIFCLSFKKMCELKFFLADPAARNLLPKGRLFLFSATRLDEDELAFYCDIPTNLLKTVGSNETNPVQKPNVKYYFIPCLDEEKKIEYTLDLLRNVNQPTLILMNNNSSCLQWYEKLSSLGKRVILVQSGLKHVDRLKAFKTFLKEPNKILLTSSNVYWEGITIKKLKLLIIPNVPFPQPTILELAQGKKTEYVKIANRRLIQGIGRIGRVPNEQGVCLLLFKPKKPFNHVSKTTIEHVKEFANFL